LLAYRCGAGVVLVDFDVVVLDLTFPRRLLDSVLVLVVSVVVFPSASVTDSLVVVSVFTSLPLFLTSVFLVVSLSVDGF